MLEMSEEIKILVLITKHEYEHLINLNVIFLHILWSLNCSRKCNIRNVLKFMYEKNLIMNETMDMK